MRTTARLRLPEHGGAIPITSTLFPAGEQVVGQTKTVVEYDVDGETGSVALYSDSDPSFETGGEVAENGWEWFALGAEHLLTGLDHILFLLALIVGSRRLRDVLLVATTFTIAHSVTFILAALGAVSLPAVIVEPLIAFSIAVVGIWYLWSVRRSHRIARAAGIDLGTEIGLESLASTPWWRWTARTTCASRWCSSSVSSTVSASRAPSASTSPSRGSCSIAADLQPRDRGRCRLGSS